MGSLNNDCSRAAECMWQALYQIVRHAQLTPVAAGESDTAWSNSLLLSQVRRPAGRAGAGVGAMPSTSGLPTSGHSGFGSGTTGWPDPEEDASVVTSLVERARGGDVDAFGQLYDRYAGTIYRYCYHRTSSVALAEDLTSETFFRALRAIASFRWQGRDFGAWLTTIARNLVADHYKSSRARLETTSDLLSEQRESSPGPEDATMTRLTHEVLANALDRLPGEQRDCVVMRFLQGLTIAETARALDRSEGAVKQLQLRAVRSLARGLPKDLR